MAPTSAQYVNAACDLGAPLSLSFLSRSTAANNSMSWRICRQCTQEGTRLVPVILPQLVEHRYRLEQRLGRGGMGTVYAASDMSLERRVAVKVIREDLVSSAEAAERFRQEARAAASFAHPNVVTVHDFGVAAGTRAFLVMEILQGSTLRDRLRLQKHLPTARVLSIVREITAALAAAHRRQLVHRDLKPENVFLVATETGEVTKLLDFGLAKFVSNPTQQRTVDTRLWRSVRYAALYVARAATRRSSPSVVGPVGARGDDLRNGDGCFSVRGHLSRGLVCGRICGAVHTRNEVHARSE
jgi:serine/threonine protein kinase